jgi:MYXO-CTERM domain-containing protein
MPRKSRLLGSPGAPLGLVIGVLAALAPPLAAAGAVKDAWYAGYSDFGNRSLVGFSEVTATTYSTSGPPDVHFADQSGLGSLSVSSADSAAMSSAQIGELRGFASSSGTPGGPGSFGNFDNGWRDFVTITGGAGIASLTIVGHFDGSLSGEHDYLASSTFAASSLASGSVGGSFVDLYGAVTQSGESCGGGSCVAQIDGARARMDFSLTIQFEYGSEVLIASVASGFADTGSLGGASTLDFLSTSKLDYLVAPEGALLTSAYSGPMAFENGRWQYVATPVPESQSLGLMLAGLSVLGLLALYRRRRSDVLGVSGGRQAIPRLSFMPADAKP